MSTDTHPHILRGHLPEGSRPPPIVQRPGPIVRPTSLSEEAQEKDRIAKEGSKYLKGGS